MSIRVLETSRSELVKARGGILTFRPAPPSGNRLPSLELESKKFPLWPSFYL